MTVTAPVTPFCLANYNVRIPYLVTLKSHAMTGSCLPEQIFGSICMTPDENSFTYLCIFINTSVSNESLLVQVPNK